MGTPVHHPADQSRRFLEQEGVWEPFSTFVYLCLTFRARQWGLRCTTLRIKSAVSWNRRESMGPFQHFYTYVCSLEHDSRDRCTTLRIRFADSWNRREFRSPFPHFNTYFCSLEHVSGSDSPFPGAERSLFLFCIAQQ